MTTKGEDGLYTYQRAMVEGLDFWTKQQATIDALVAALEVARSRIAGEWWEDHPDVQQIDAALALARKGG